MKTNTKQRLLTLVEGAAMVALAIVIDLLMGFIPSQPEGGSITLAMLPVLFFAYRRGTAAGVMAGLVWSVTQMITGGFYVPPANTWWAIVLCVLLDYVLVFSASGLAPLFAKLCGQKRLMGYSVGAVATGIIRYISHALSGALLWGSYAPEGMNVWIYTITYNGAYMIPNIILAGVLIVPLCLAVDPLTLRRYRKAQ
ncbi:MAG: energy-coupled thiamine transporter ThiT [Clostridia bacterium]|nr:energy-coupled thiamine transporter ThiT [Clostridia bacterium]